MAISVQAVTGQADAHIVQVAGLGRLHADIVAPLQALQASALSAGLSLAVASGYRSFERQLTIWNAKALGHRAVLDGAGQSVNMAHLSGQEKVFAMLRWSALPGASRHHWGTDIDVWNPAAVTDDYQLQLLPEEYQENGPFEPLSRWLDKQITMADTLFFRPYQFDKGGVAPELWHLSYRPLALEFELALTPKLLLEVLAQSDIELKDDIIANMDEIFARFVASSLVI